MTKRANYVQHDFRPFENNDMGPDVEWSPMTTMRLAGRFMGLLSSFRIYTVHTDRTYRYIRFIRLCHKSRMAYSCGGRGNFRECQ